MKSRKTAVLDQPQDKEPATATPPRRAKSGGSRLGWLLSRFFILLILLAVLAFFAPTLIANTGAWPWLLAKATGGQPYGIKTGSPQLGWMSPIVIPQLEIRDAAGEVLATVEQVATDKTLLSLAMNPMQPGLITLNKPQMRIVLPAVAAALTAPASPASTPAPTATAETSLPKGLSVRIIDGSVEVVDAATNRSWNFSQLNVALDTPVLPTEPLQFDIALASATAGTNQTGWLKSQGKIVLAPGAKPVGEVAFEASGIDLSVIGPATRQFVGELATQGVLSAKAAVQLAEAGVYVNLQQFNVPELAVSAPKYLGNDVVVIRQLGGQGEVTINGTQVAAKQFMLASDTARLDADGILHVGEMTPAGLFKALATGRPDEPLQLSAQVDLAKLMKSMPSTVKLRPGTEIQHGRIALQVSRDPQSAVPRVTGSLSTSEFVALNDGQQIKWDQPIKASFAVSQSEQGPQLEQLKCVAEFLQIEAAGSMTQGRATLQGDLNRLMAELNKIVHVPELELAGSLTGRIDWQNGAGDAWNAKAEARLQDFLVKAAKMQPWQEKDLQLVAEVAGIVQDGVLKRIERGTAGIVSGNDKFNGQLLQPVDAPSAASIWPVSWNLSGNLATWVPRLQPVAPVQKIQAEGELLVQGSAAVSPTSANIEKLSIRGQKVRAMAPGFFIDEDELQFDTSASWDGATGNINIPVTTFASSTLAFRADQLKITYGAQGFSAVGTVDYRGNVERLAQLVEDPRLPPKTRMAGNLSGRLNLNFQQGVTEAKFTSSIADLVYAVPRERIAGAALVSAPENPDWKVQWADKKLALQGQLAYDAANDILKILSADVQMTSISAGAAGQIAALTTQPFIDVSGKLIYDLADVIREAANREEMKSMKSFLDDLKVQGKEERPFMLRGPLNALTASTTTSAAAGPRINVGAPTPTGLVSNELEGKFGIGWQAVEYAGLQFGTANIEATLQQGTINFAPISIPVSQGQMNAVPHILLNNDPPVAVVDRGTLLDHVQITPELCRGWMKFVAPMIADATAAQGKFSVDLDGTNVPLFEPTKSDIAGALRVHDVTVGPGPLAMNLVGLMQQVRSVVDAKPFDTTSPDGATWLKIKDQKVDFRVVDGRVHHRGMKMTVKDVELTTDGSVGFDQTLELVAKVPIRDEWLKGELAASLKGQVLEVPVRGTISKPQLDRRALENLTKSFVQGAAKNLLEDQLNKRLKGLFGPGK